MSGICDSECLIGFYAASQVTDSFCVTCFTEFVCSLFTVWQGCSVSHEDAAVFDKLVCCSRAQTPKMMSQSAWHVIRPAWTAEDQAHTTAQCALHSRSCLMTAAACPAVEMRHATIINRYPGSAVTAQSHEVDENPHRQPAKHTQITVLRHVPLR